MSEEVREKKYFQQICAPSYSYVWRLMLHNIHVITGGLYEKDQFTTTSKYDVLTSKEANVVSVLNFGYCTVICWLLRKLTQKRSEFA